MCDGLNPYPSVGVTLTACSNAFECCAEGHGSEAFGKLSISHQKFPRSLKSDGVSAKKSFVSDFSLIIFLYSFAMLALVCHFVFTFIYIQSQPPQVQHKVTAGSNILFQIGRRDFLCFDNLFCSNERV